MTIREKGAVMIHLKIIDKIARNRTPIKNLYTVGSSSFPGAGINNTIASGIVTSSIILKDLKRN